MCSVLAFDRTEYSVQHGQQTIRRHPFKHTFTTLGSTCYRLILAENGRIKRFLHKIQGHKDIL